jgi:hypothetical protein
MRSGEHAERQTGQRIRRREGLDRDTHADGNRNTEAIQGRGNRGPDDGV